MGPWNIGDGELAGWDFSEIWTIDTAPDSQQHPALQWWVDES